MPPSPSASRPRRGAVLAAAPWLLFALFCGCSSAEPPPAPDLPPIAGHVRDGTGADRDEQSPDASLFANWDEFRDPEGLPVVYEWAVGTAPGSDDIMRWTNVGGATNASAVGAVLPPGKKVFVSVRARDIAGGCSAVSTSDGVVVGGRAQAPASTTGAATGVSDGAAAGGDDLGRRTTLERFGISWTFDRAARCGQFVNGDWWVLGPIKVVSIEPPCIVEAGRVRNGSMINPDPRSPKHGYDSAIFEPGGASGYDAALNVAREVSLAQPLRLDPDRSLVSTISHPQAGQLPQLETCAVLTCLLQPPPDGAFRPPYCGADKRCRWKVAALDTGRLASLAAPDGAPDLSGLAERFERPWLDHIGGWAGRLLHPRLNMPDYGRDIADLVGLAGLALQLDHPVEAKRPLAIGLIQLGIDLFGIVDNGGRFVADGGNGSGRKFPILLAGALLHDERLQRCAKTKTIAFAEDVQTFFVEETSPGVWNNGHGNYGDGDKGLPEWGIKHADDPSLDNKSWTGDPNRRCCTAHAWHGFVLATRIMGLVDAWSHDALFEYVDRYMQTEPSGNWMRSWNPFAEQMWDRYRAAF